jgi:Rod binding domain-containing protein
MDILQTAQIGNIGDLSQVDAVRNAVSKSDSDSSGKIENVAKKFEGMLLHEMFKQVQEGLEALNESDDEEESGSEACNEQYQSLYWSQLADAVSDQGGVGFWKTIYGQIHQQVDKVESAGGLLNEDV